MASKALHNGVVKSPRQVEKGADIYCTECGEPMYVVEAHTRTDIDGVVPRHFSHYPDGDAGDCPGGESEEHERWKGFASSALEELFDNRSSFVRQEGQLEAPVSDKDSREADALAVFNNPDPQLGRGVAIEVQYKNKGKDIATTTSDYVKQGIAVVWTDADDYADNRVLLTERDIRDRAREAAWPQEVPRCPDVPMTPVTDDYLPSAYIAATGEALTGQPPTPRLPPEFVDKVAQEIKRDVDWDSLFTQRTKPDMELDDLYFHVTGRNLSGEPPTPRLPPEFVDEAAQRIKSNVSWGMLFDAPIITDDDLPSLYNEAAEEPLSADLPAVRLPPDALRPDELVATIQRQTPWEELFDDSLVLDDLEAIYTETTGEQLKSHPPAATLPPDFIDQIARWVWQRQPWRELFSPPTQRLCFGEEWSLKIEIPFEQWLVEGGSYSHTYRQPASPADPQERPQTSYDDIQCHRCGKYWYWKELRTTCQTCGAAISYEWNVQTGRISRDTYRKAQRRLNITLSTQRSADAD